VNEVQRARRVPSAPERVEHLGAEAFREALVVDAIGIRNLFPGSPLAPPPKKNGWGKLGPSSSSSQCNQPAYLASSTAFIVGRKHKFVYSFGYISNTFSIYHNNDLLTLILLTL
jgi:hypothetical protein